MRPTRPQVKAAIRREKTAYLLATGLSSREIGVRLGCSERTIKYDVSRIRAAAREEVSATTVLDIAASLELSAAARLRELWDAVERSKGLEAKHKRGDPIFLVDGRTVIAALREIRATEESRVKVLQDLGVVYKAPAKVIAELAWNAKMDEMTPSALERLAGTSTTEQFEAVLVELLGAAEAQKMLGVPREVFEDEPEPVT
jgi:hypothetical protein